MTRCSRARNPARLASLLLPTVLTVALVVGCQGSPLRINPYSFVGRPTMDVAGDLDSLRIAPSGRSIAFAGPLRYMGQPAIFVAPLDGSVRVAGPMSDEVNFGLYWTQNETSFTYLASGTDGMEVNRLSVAGGRTTTLARAKGWVSMVAPPVGDHVVWYGTVEECFYKESEEDAADQPEKDDAEEPAERPAEQKQVDLPVNFPWGVLSAANEPVDEDAGLDCPDEPRGGTPFTMLNAATGDVGTILKGVFPQDAAWSKDGTKLALMYRKSRRSPYTLAILDIGSEQPVEVGQVAEPPRIIEWTSAGELVTVTMGPDKLTVRRYIQGRDEPITTVDFEAQGIGRTFLVLSPDGKRILSFDDFHRHDMFIPEDPNPQSHPEPTVQNAVIDIESAAIKKFPWRVVPHGWLDANRIFISTGVGDYKKYGVVDVRSL